MTNRQKDWTAYGVYSLVALAIMLPLLLPGFILTLDMVFTPQLRLPQEVTSSYPFHALLYLLNLALPSDIIQKVLLIGILLLSAIGMHRLIRALQPAQAESGWGIYFASIFYMINPFTYSRFMAGQYAVLLGFALLPWFARLLLKFTHRPQLKNALKLGGLAAVVGIVSIHTLAMLAVLGLAALGIMLWRYRGKVRSYLKYGTVVLGLFAVLSGFWLVPLALGQGKTAAILQSFGHADTEAFAATGDNPVARIGNVLRLQGFWAENRGQFLLPQDITVLWGTMALAIIAAVVIGVVVLWRRSRTLAVFLAATLLAAVLLAAGLLTPITDRLPLGSGLREPHKMAGLVALSYCVFAAFGINAFLGWLRAKTENGYNIAAVAVLILPFVFMRIMFWGFHGQLTPQQYPADWFSVNQHLNKDTDDFAVLFLPWHQYMSFGFAGRIIANPAPSFFDRTMVVSTDPELGGAAGGPPSEREEAIGKLLAAPEKNDFASELAKHNIKYILVAKELDYQKYDYLTQAPGVEQAGDHPSLILYVNNDWKADL